jgi:hypothetical protein
MSTNTKLLPASIGVYRIVEPEELTAEQLATLRSISRERVMERLEVLTGSGLVTFSLVLRRYHALMEEAGKDLVVQPEKQTRGSQI